MLRRLTTSLPLRSLLLQSSTLPACQAPTPSVSFLARSFSGLSLRPTHSISPSSSALAKLFPQQAFGLQGSPLLGQIRTAYVEKLKTYKPTSPGIRFRKIVDRSHLWKGKPMRHLTVALRKTGGRNNHGHITVRHRGGGHKRRYRLVDFKRNKEAENTVVRLEYDPNRSAWIALLKNTKTEEYSYILCPKNLEPGDTVHSGESVEIKIGNSCPLKNMPVGTIIHNIEMKPGRGGQLARTAGAYAQLLKTGPEGFAYVRLPSTEVRMVSVHCRATVGSVSNSLHKNTVLGKAGALRWKGRRPHVRGVAMNPIDHPHGGGEGKGAPGRPSVSPWGKLAKSGKKTRNRHKFSNKFVVEPRKRGKNRK